jgi:hypothetical protein
MAQLWLLYCCLKTLGTGIKLLMAGIVFAEPLALQKQSPASGLWVINASTDIAILKLSMKLPPDETIYSLESRQLQHLQALAKADEVDWLLLMLTFPS